MIVTIPVTHIVNKFKFRDSFNILRDFNVRCMIFFNIVIIYLIQRRVSDQSGARTIQDCCLDVKCYPSILDVLNQTDKLIFLCDNRIRQTYTRWTY